MSHQWSVLYAKKFKGSWRRVSSQVILDIGHVQGSAILSVQYQGRILEKVHLTGSVVFSALHSEIRFVYHDYQETKEFTVRFDSEARAKECKSVLSSFESVPSLQAQPSTLPQSQSHSQPQTQSQLPGVEHIDQFQLSSQGHEDPMVDAASSQRVGVAGALESLVLVGTEDNQRQRQALVATIKQLLKDENFKELLRTVEEIVNTEPDILQELV